MVAVVYATLDVPPDVVIEFVARGEDGYDNGSWGTYRTPLYMNGLGATTVALSDK